MMEGASADAYRPAGKAAKPVLCPECKATFRRGRWRWGAAPAGAVRRKCPACLRIAQRYPAGYITVSGAFFNAHRDEILARVRHCETQEQGAHPLERAFKGELSQSYSPGDNVLRVRWSRAQ